MTGYATKSVFALLAEESLNSGLISSIESHHPSLECHMTELQEGLVEDLGSVGPSAPPPTPALGDNTAQAKMPLERL